MVTSVGEFRAARTHLTAVAARLGIRTPPPLGVMIEVPSAALLADRFAEEVEFFSIGTNDLTQYALAVDRANPEVSSLFRALHPAILRMIKIVVAAGAARGRPVAVCGEMASEPIGIAALVGLGIREISVTPVAIPGIKQNISAVDAARAASQIGRALECDDPAEVERIFRGRDEAEARRVAPARAASENREGSA